MMYCLSCKKKAVLSEADNSTESALRLSLETALQHPSCVDATWLEDIHIKLCRLRAIPAGSTCGSFYWVDHHDNLLCMAFPAVLNLAGAHIEGAKDIFQLSPITNSLVNDIPTKAIQCDLDPSERYTSTPFHRIDSTSNQVILLASTGPLIRDSRTTIFPKHTSNPSNPSSSQMRMLSLNNSNLVERFDKQDDIEVDVHSIMGPENVYSTTFEHLTVSNSFINVPNIRDGDGDLITPLEYRVRIKDGSIVMANVYLKLQVEDDGQRFYQLIINSMQTFPVTDIFQITASNSNNYTDDPFLAL